MNPLGLSGTQEKVGLSEAVGRGNVAGAETLSQGQEQSGLLGPSAASGLQQVG